MRKSIFDIFEKQEGKKVVSIPLEQIQPSRYQPRLKFDADSLRELSESIRETGLIQPITVREIDDHYEIIAGERRYRASEMAGLSEIDCYIMTPTEDQAAQMALVENIQRKDLSAIEEARSYVQISRQFGMTQEQIAKKVGKSQSAIANKIRLLKLPDEIQEGVIEGKITERHARAMLSVPEEKQKPLYHTVLQKGLNVRETENEIEKILKPKKTKRKQKTKGFTRNMQIAVNSVKQCVQMITKMGISADMDLRETDDELQMIIRVPKG